MILFFHGFVFHAKRKRAKKTLIETQSSGHVINHHYSAVQMALLCQLVIYGALGMRTAARSLEIFNRFFALSLPSPCWYSVRLWLMRLGYFQFMRPKVIAEDWLWVVDYSIQLGHTKCLLILGIRQQDLPTSRPLQHTDMEPILLQPTATSTKKVVLQQLESAVEKTGAPRAIISDNGCDLKAGINLFCLQHQDTAFIYDIKHKIALMIKKRLENDPQWQAFTAFATKIKKKLQQTPYAYLTPPALRVKARYMNLDSRLTWAQKVLKVLSVIENKKHPLVEKLGEMKNYRTDIECWLEMLAIANDTETFLRKNYLSKQSYLQLKSELQKHRSLIYENNTIFQNDLLAFIEQQGALCRGNEKLLAHSEIIESVFGKQKYIEGEQSKSGFTGLVLAIGAIVSNIIPSLMKQALEKVPIQKIKDWQKENLGKSLQSQYSDEFLVIAKEQK